MNGGDSVSHHMIDSGYVMGREERRFPRVSFCFFPPEIISSGLKDVSQEKPSSLKVENLSFVRAPR